MTWKLDADTTAFFQRELEHIYARSFDIVYPELRARSFVPVSGEANIGATTVTYEQYDRTGKAKIISNNAKDIPRVDIDGKEFTRPVRTVGIGFGFTLMEIRAAAMAGKNLSARKADAARRGIEEVLDSVACFGSPDHGIATGFLNNADVTATAVGGGNDWATLIATGLDADRQKIIKQLSDALGRITTDSKGTEMANTIIIPDAQYTLIATTPFGDNSDKTILDFMNANFPMIQAIEPWYRLDGAGAGATDRVVVYNRMADKVQQEIPGEYEQLPPQEQGLEMVVHAVASTAGTAVYFPKSMQYVDGV